MKNNTYKNIALLILSCTSLMVINTLIPQSPQPEPELIIQPEEALNIPFPDFLLPSLTEPGNKMDKSAIKGHKTLVNLWATWCPTCYAEHSYLNTLNKQGIRLVGVNYKDTPEKALSWLKMHNNPYQSVINDSDGLLGGKLNVYGAPVTFFVNSDGVIEYQHTGAINEKVWNEKLQHIYKNLK